MFMCVLLCARGVCVSVCVCPCSLVCAGVSEEDRLCVYVSACLVCVFLEN